MPNVSKLSGASKFAGTPFTIKEVPANFLPYANMKKSVTLISVSFVFSDYRHKSRCLPVGMWVSNLLLCQRPLWL